MEKEIENFDDLFEYIDGLLTIKEKVKPKTNTQVGCRLRNEDKKENDLDYLFDAR